MREAITRFYAQNFPFNDTCCWSETSMGMKTLVHLTCTFNCLTYALYTSIGLPWSKSNCMPRSGSKTLAGKWPISTLFELSSRRAKGALGSYSDDWYGTGLFKRASELRVRRKQQNMRFARGLKAFEISAAAGLRLGTQQQIMPMGSSRVWRRIESHK